ncbi:FAD dependent oxidoreductase [Dipodascopsis uninucleata]
MISLDKTSKIRIIGAGAFGLSTAYYLLLNGYKDIIIYDRQLPPVQDGSSVDISRIVRPDYRDVVYAKMAVEAREIWSQDEIYKDTYHECGLLVMTHSDKSIYATDAYRIVKDLHLPVTTFNSGEEAAQYYKLDTETTLKGLSGYVNHRAGWAYASKAIEQLAAKVHELGAKFLAHAVTKVIYSSDGTRVDYVEFEDGETDAKCSGDLYIMATGAWTDSIVDMRCSVLATGQPVAYIQLTDEEYEKFKHLPIYINFLSGFYVFPPHPETKVLKAARHGFGYTRYENSLDGTRKSSQPPFVVYSKGEKPEIRNMLPKDAQQCIREGLLEYLGAEIADRQYLKARICWYNDTPTQDFIFDYKPDVKNMFIATGGSGHAFKFLPVLGKYAVGCLERTLSSDLLEKFAWREEQESKQDFSRGGTQMMSLTEAEAI